MDDVLVIGAGISGLACAHALGARRTVRVLEAAPRAGGLVRSVAEDGFRWEEGPEALPPAASAVRALCNELALPIEEASAAAARRYVLHGGALVEVSASPPARLPRGPRDRVGPVEEVLVNPREAATRELLELG